MISIRNEKKTDYKKVEEITRKTFYNLYISGCNEHYLLHVMRSHVNFAPELDFVIEDDNQVIGNIMYTKAKLVDETGEERGILTFGSFCILPEYQRMGDGKLLMEHSFEKAVELGYKIVVIFWNHQPQAVETEELPINRRSWEVSEGFLNKITLRLILLSGLMLGYL